MLMVEKIKKKNSIAKSSSGSTLETPPANSAAQDPSAVKPARLQARSGGSTNPRTVTTSAGPTMWPGCRTGARLTPVTGAVKRTKPQVRYKIP